MKKKFLVLCYFYTVIDTRYKFNDEKDETTERMLLVSSCEGEFASKEDAEERIKGMIEEESQRPEADKKTDPMYFEVKEVFGLD